ncbi:MAG TPA: glycosyltransferase [Myxococcota bacterium]|jgi:glycosyltransferase involved in cell wall biosynthesis
MDLLVSAVVCTHNRATVLRRALASLGAQTLAPDRYEIVVVDNASTDATRDLVTRELAGMPQLRYVFEPQLGVSRARNAGWRAARAPLVAYLDDDAIAAPDWLARAVADFARLEPRPGCLGGPVLPIWEAPRPDWLPDALLPYLTVLELDQTAGPMPRGKFLYGTNSVFPRERLAEIGGYPAGLGPIGSWHRSGEDTFVQKLLRERGLQLWYDPALRVQHHLPAERVSRRWVLRRLYLEGLSRARQQLLAREPGPLARLKLIGVALRKLGSSPRRLLALVLPASTPERFARRASSWRRLGYLMGVLGAGAGTQARGPGATRPPA